MNIHNNMKITFKIIYFTVSIILPKNQYSGFKIFIMNSLRCVYCVVFDTSLINCSYTSPFQKPNLNLYTNSSKYDCILFGIIPFIFLIRNLPFPHMPSMAFVQHPPSDLNSTLWLTVLCL